MPLMRREDALQNIEDGEPSYYMDEFTDYVPDLASFVQRTKGRGRVFLTFSFLEAENLKKVIAELFARKERGTLTMGDP